MKAKELDYTEEEWLAWEQRLAREKGDKLIFIVVLGMTSSLRRPSNNMKGVITRLQTPWFGFTKYLESFWITTFYVTRPPALR